MDETATTHRPLSDIDELKQSVSAMKAQVAALQLRDSIAEEEKRRYLAALVCLRDAARQAVNELLDEGHQFGPGLQRLELLSFAMGLLTDQWPTFVFEERPRDTGDIGGKNG